MRKKLLMLFTLGGVLFGVHCNLAAADAGSNGASADFESDRQIILKNLREEHFDPNAKPYLKGFQEDGTWRDLDYKNHARSIGWAPREHLFRMIKLASCQPELAVKALRAWQRLDPQSDNWWNPCIGTPKWLCYTIILIGPDNIPADLLRALKPILERSRTGNLTGQNLVWVKEIHLMTGLIYGDSALVRKSRDVILSELKIAKRGQEGLQDDFSYHQHGPQQQFGNYGLSFFSDQVQWALALHGTTLAYPPKKLELLDKYFMDGLRWTLWDHKMEYSACDRQLWMDLPKRKYDTIVKNAKKLSRILPDERKAEYDRWFRRPLALVGARAFPRSACLFYRSAKWCFSLKMGSPDIIGSETINNENMRGLYQGDGAYFFGNMERYKDFPALCDPYLLPGTTEIRDPKKSLVVPWAHKRNKNGYYAIYADYPVAIAALRLDTGDLQADKVWFCTTDGISCSGSDIRSSSGSPVMTTIDQFRTEEKFAFPFAYSVPEDMPQPVHTETDVATDWKIVCKDFVEPQPVSGKMVLIRIDHGIKPDGARYFYRIGTAEPSQIAVTRIPSSSPRIHAVEAEKRILAAAFVDGTIPMKSGKTLRVKPGITVFSLDGTQLHHTDFITK